MKVTTCVKIFFCKQVFELLRYFKNRNKKNRYKQNRLFITKNLFLFIVIAKSLLAEIGM